MEPSEIFCVPNSKYHLSHHYSHILAPLSFSVSQSIRSNSPKHSPRLSDYSFNFGVISIHLVETIPQNRKLRQLKTTTDNSLISVGTREMSRGLSWWWFKQMPPNPSLLGGAWKPIYICRCRCPCWESSGGAATRMEQHQTNTFCRKSFHPAFIPTS